MAGTAAAADAPAPAPAPAPSSPKDFTSDIRTSAAGLVASARDAASDATTHAASGLGFDPNILRSVPAFSDPTDRPALVDFLHGMRREAALLATAVAEGRERRRGTDNDDDDSGLKKVGSGGEYGAAAPSGVGAGAGAGAGAMDVTRGDDEDGDLLRAARKLEAEAEARLAAVTSVSAASGGRNGA